MANSSLKNRILGISPVIEIAVRHFYWKNRKTVEKFRKKFSGKTPKTVKSGESTDKVVCSENDFTDVVKHIEKQCIDKGDSIILHSSFGSLKKFGMSPEQVIAAFIHMLGESGTLSMPAMPVIRNAPKMDSYLNNDGDDSQVYRYSVKSKRVKTGALGAAILNDSECVRSLHPINTLASIGWHAHYIMKDNIEKDDNLPCGKNSSWYKCAELNSLIVGLGIDLTHSLTMIHVAEDARKGGWPVKKWYRKKNFVVDNHGIESTHTFDERRPSWGTLHFAERTLCRDLVKARILHTTIVHGIVVEYMRSKELLEFLASKNDKGYPYFFTGKMS